MTSYFILLLIAGALNIAVSDRRMVMLCAVVGFGISVPIPDHNFYAWCAVVEVFVMACALALNTAASRPVVALSLSLCAFHYLGYKFNGYPPDSPYHFLVKITEHAELAACALFSKPLMGRLKHASK